MGNEASLCVIRSRTALFLHKAIGFFDYLLSTRLHAQIVQPQLEYGLAITAFNLPEIQSLENCQSQCIHQIFGGRPFTSTKVMICLINLSIMKDRISILQAQLLFRTSFLPDDALLTRLLTYIQSQLSNEHLETMTHNNFIRKRRQFLIDNHRSKLQGKHSKLLSHCRNIVIVDPILWIPMTRSERSCSFSFHPNELFSRLHSFSCLDMHSCLQLPKSIDDPLSYLLNFLPPTLLTKKARKLIDAWLIRWPTICAILFEMDCLAHSQLPDPSDHLGEPFVKRSLHIKHRFSDS
ncbi:hypothetical protein BCV72DRAFT_252559 [Rhizopus microsporus var. microsporus]|uniref:Uncharacterized protein n=1 Tax=Rhizopus microsporus var. microsporus TaxID=86635 RepID=A0A1X0QRB2_RHIZD|nr:hypothetical protein BCV72DRAFT_252559 [Rhizopus microsporus var. microsporus]